MEVGAMFQLVALCRSVVTGLLTSTVELLVAMTWLFTSLLCSTASVSEAECLEAVRGLLPQSQAQGRRNLVAGSWGHVPVGCSVQSGGDWIAHFNRRASGSNDGDYSPVCSGPAATIVEETQSDSGVKQCGSINGCGQSQRRYF